MASFPLAVDCDCCPDCCEDCEGNHCYELWEVVATCSEGGANLGDKVYLGQVCLDPEEASASWFLHESDSEGCTYRKHVDTGRCCQYSSCGTDSTPTEPEDDPDTSDCVCGEPTDCPEDLSGCPASITVSVSGTGFADADVTQNALNVGTQYHYINNGYPGCPDPPYPEGVTVSTTVSCAASTPPKWLLSRASNGGPDCSTGATITWEAPVTGPCPPTTGWVLTSNGFGGVPVLTVSY